MSLSGRKVSDDPLRALIRAIQESRPPPRSLIGYSYVPRFIQPPRVELTKAMVSGVDCDEVYPGIFVGDEGSARNKEFLKAVGITHVLNTAEGPGLGQVSTGATYYADTGIKYMGLSLSDMPTTRIINYFEEGTDFIDSAITSGGKVLVHCLMGLSRSSTFVIAYLMMKKGMTAEESLRMVCQHREVRPNDGFLVQLLQQEKQLFGDAK